MLRPLSKRDRQAFLSAWNRATHAFFGAHWAIRQNNPNMMALAYPVYCQDYDQALTDLRKITGLPSRVVAPALVASGGPA